MQNILIIISRKGGNTEKLARAVLKGTKTITGINARLKEVREVTEEDLLEAKGIIIGSPVYFGSMSFELKEFIDRTYPLRGKLKDKIGAAFATSDDPLGGKETTILSIILAMLIHQMIIVGEPLEAGGYYGASSVGDPDKKEISVAVSLGKRVAQIVKNMF
ncbi:MAG: flavodoxin family protein [Candidatus Firestonebacteria bacterium]|nr:flavodoxin family protein [Candidatus Firestonebacteria bacterium]